MMSSSKSKVDVPKIAIERVMNRRYMRFLFNNPTLDECNAILKRFKADQRKVRRENPIYKNSIK
jgi:hypothetical protein